MVGRSVLVHPDAAPADPVKIAKMAWETLRVSVDLLRESRRIRATHILVPDFLTALRNGPALLWLRARGLTIVLRLQNAPDEGTLLSAALAVGRQPADRSLRVQLGIHAARAARATGSPRGKVSTIPNAASPRRESWALAGARSRRANHLRRSDHSGQGPRPAARCGRDPPRRAESTRRWTSSATWTAGSRRASRATTRACAHARERPDLKGAVQFLGHREDVPTLMSRASVHCCPSLPANPRGVRPRGARSEVVRAAVGRVAERQSSVARRSSPDRLGLSAKRQPRIVAEGLAFFLTDPSRLSAARVAAAASAADYSEERFAERLGERCSTARRRNRYAREPPRTAGRDADHGPWAASTPTTGSSARRFSSCG